MTLLVGGSRTFSHACARAIPADRDVRAANVLVCLLLGYTILWAPGPCGRMLQDCALRMSCVCAAHQGRHSKAVLRWLGQVLRAGRSGGSPPFVPQKWLRGAFFLQISEHYPRLLVYRADHASRRRRCPGQHPRSCAASVMQVWPSLIGTLAFVRAGMSRPPRLCAFALPAQRAPIRTRSACCFMSAHGHPELSLRTQCQRREGRGAGQQGKENFRAMSCVFGARAACRSFSFFGHPSTTLPLKLPSCPAYSSPAPFPRFAASGRGSRKRQKGKSARIGRRPAIVIDGFSALTWAAMQFPEDAAVPEQVHALMRQCWDPVPAARPRSAAGSPRLLPLASAVFVLLSSNVFSLARNSCSMTSVVTRLAAFVTAAGLMVTVTLVPTRSLDQQEERNRT